MTNKKIGYKLFIYKDWIRSIFKKKGIPNYIPEEQMDKYVEKRDEKTKQNKKQI